MIKIVITDDHKLFRIGLSELLKKQKDIEVVAELSNGREFLDFILKNSDIDIVLLDITMPELDGFEVLDKLAELKSSIKPIIISMFDDGNYIAKCAKSGAFSYLLKNTDEYELIKAIRIVAQGKKYFNQVISEKMINFMSTQHTSVKKLSNKESEILILISKGFTTKDIALKLFISTRTVETHRANILKKLEVKNTASLIKKATENKLI
ncbi:MULTISPECIES: response regulator [unclassified Polaribacter]|uniref:response regulator transcription factor n=1 Tax=unclassified Polaribacter TaxID=196858 RepID=UPI0011BE43A0|nr:MULTISPECIES: response regulator transcription factor [unclassified Polaribacter]TXD53962.1 response regulator transcription factor [Polaribacter sp. IC063]TXD59671.1 response regulator transcription factor [Polaribacter sp. IC066]